LDLGEDLSQDNYFKRRYPDYRQHMFCRIPCDTHHWRNRGEYILSSLVSKRGYVGVDIRIRRTTSHYKGPGFTKSGVRLSWHNAVILHKALGELLDKVGEEIQAGRIQLQEEEE
jgi:hypothetical protein